MYGTLWFAKQVIFGAHYCDVNCFIVSKKLDVENDFVVESTSLYLKGEVVPDTLCPLI